MYSAVYHGRKALNQTNKSIDFKWHKTCILFQLQISRISSPSSLIDDDCSVISELSTSSVSAGSLSDDENIEEVSF